MSAESFASLEARLAAVARRLGGTLDILGEIEGYPLLRLTAGPALAPRLLIDAGLHGEEPAGPLGLATWLEDDAPARVGRLHLTVLPCLNPWGFERGLRRSRDAEDRNRLFDDPDSPLTALVAAATAGARFALAMDLHEDSDFTAAYCYELKAGPPFLGERLLAGFAARGVALSHDEAVGDFRTDHGWIRPGPDAARLRARTGWPIAYYHLTRLTDHVVTVETPGRLPLRERIGLQRAALSGAAAFLLEPGAGDIMATP